MDYDLKRRSLRLVCFRCRKMFRKTALRSRFCKPNVISHSISCPQCDEQTVEVGSCFQPPPSRDLRRWKKLEALYERGYRWFPDAFGDCHDRGI